MNHASQIMAAETAMEAGRASVHATGALPTSTLRVIVVAVCVKCVDDILKEWAKTRSPTLDRASAYVRGSIGHVFAARAPGPHNLAAIDNAITAVVDTGDASFASDVEFSVMIDALDVLKRAIGTAGKVSRDVMLDAFLCQFYVAELRGASEKGGGELTSFALGEDPFASYRKVQEAKESVIQLLSLAVSLPFHGDMIGESVRHLLASQDLTQLDLRSSHPG